MDQLAVRSPFSQDSTPILGASKRSWSYHLRVMHIRPGCRSSPLRACLSIAPLMLVGGAASDARYDIRNRFRLTGIGGKCLRLRAYSCSVPATGTTVQVAYDYYGREVVA